MSPAEAGQWILAFARLPMSYPVATMVLGLAIFAWGAYGKFWAAPTEVVMTEKRDIPPSPGPNFKFEGPSNNQFSFNPQPTPPAPQRNPNGLYQLNERVGTVVGANVMLANGRIAFDEIYGVNELNDQQTFEYQDYVLRFISADGKTPMRAAMSLMGMSKNGTFQQSIVPKVLCEIVAKRQ